jgi:PAS domain S-box-containing protein
VLILAAFVTLRQQLLMTSNRQAVMASYELSSQLEKPLRLLQDAENAEQAYLLTGDQGSLSPFHKAAEELDPVFDRLQRQYEGNEKEIQQLKKLKDYYDQEFSQLRKYIGEREKTPKVSATPLAIRAVIDKIKANSHDLPLATYREQRQFRMTASKDLLQQSESSTIELLCLVGMALVAVTGASVYAIYQLKAKDLAIEMVRQVALETVATQEKLAAVLSSMDEGLCLLDEKGKLTYINQAGERLLGYKVEGIIEADLHQLIHNRLPDGSACQTGECPLKNAAASGVTHRAADDYFVRGDGDFLPVHYISSPLITNGVITGAVLAFFDISERKLDEMR